MGTKRIEGPTRVMLKLMEGMEPGRHMTAREIYEAAGARPAADSREVLGRMVNRGYLDRREFTDALGFNRATYALKQEAAGGGGSGDTKPVTHQIPENIIRLPADVTREGLAQSGA